MRLVCYWASNQCLLKGNADCEYPLYCSFYIIFTDNKIDESGSIVTYAATYTKEDGELKLSDIETEKEWNLIENLLAQIEDKIEE